MLFKSFLALLVSFAGWALAASNAIASRDECIAQDVTQVYIQTYEFVYLVIIDQYCPSNTVITLDNGATYVVTETSSFTSTLTQGSAITSGSSDPVAATSGSSDSAVASAAASAAASVFSQQAVSLVVTQYASPSNLYFIPADTSLPLNSTVALNSTVGLNSTTSPACLSVTTTSLTVTQTPSAMTAFVTKNQNITEHLTNTVYTTLVIYTTITDLSSTTTTSSTTDINSETMQMTIPYTTIVATSSITTFVSTETSVTTIVTAASTSYYDVLDSTVQIAARSLPTPILEDIEIVPRYLATAMSYCANALTTSVTVTEFATTPTITVTQIQNSTYSIFGTASVSLSTTLSRTESQYLTSTITSTISTTSTILNYNTLTASETTFQTLPQTATTTSTTTASGGTTVASPASSFYLQVPSGYTHSGKYLTFDYDNGETSAYPTSSKSAAKACSLNSNSNLVCNNLVLSQGTGTRALSFFSQSVEASYATVGFVELTCSFSGDLLTCGPHLDTPTLSFALELLI